MIRESDHVGIQSLNKDSFFLHIAYATTVVYNTMSNSTLEMDMTSMPANMTSLSVNMSTYSMNPTQSSMTYSASANVTDMSYNSSVLLTPSSAVSMPFVCPNESCWVEIECMSRKLTFFSLSEKTNTWEWFFFCVR